MTRRPTALVGAVIVSIAVLTGTQVNARTKQKNNSHPIQDHQHSIGSPSYGPHYQEKRYPWPRRISRAPIKANGVLSAFTNRDCLDAPTRTLLANLEARFGRVALVKVCVPGARMPSGHVSWHAKRKAFDFRVPKNADQRDVMVWLTRHSSGVTISYRGALAGIIHTDTGNFHKVIYNAASHEAGERAVAIWQERERAAVLVASVPPPLPLPRPDIEAPPIVVASLGDDLVFQEYAVQPDPVRPEPIGDNDRRSIFRRYAESREIIAKPWVTTSCPNGRELPKGLLTLLQDSASHYGRTVYVNSAYRSPEYNRRVRGAARNSQHIKCRAVDFRVAGVSSSDVRRWVAANLSRWGITGLGYYGPSGHLHADVRPLTKASRIVTWTGGHKRYAKRRHQRYAAAG